MALIPTLSSQGTPMALAPAKSPRPRKARAIVRRTRDRTRVPPGSSGSASSATASPSPIIYLAVRLTAGERWRYEPPEGHTVLWAAVASGVLSAPDELRHGDLAAFEPSSDAVEFEALTDTEFVLGSAVPHEHDLVLGYYSVHTSPDALRDAEAHISAIRTRLVQEGRL